MRKLTLAGKVVTLEISSTNIKLMETEGGRVTKWASRSLEPGVFDEEVISDRRALGAAVKQLMTTSGIKGKDVIASVSGLYSTSRIVAVTNPGGGVTTPVAVLEAAKEVMPLSEDELYFSWQATATVEGGQQVLVMGVPRDVIDSEVQALRAVGINPRTLGLKAMALMRAVNREQALILNIEPSSFDIVIVVNGIPEVMHTIAWQQDDLTVEEKAEHLGSVLELTVGFYNSHNPDLPLDPATPLFITGQMSGELTLMENLQARVGYAIEPLAPPLQYPAHLPVSQYAVNIGLALKGGVPSRDVVGGGDYLPLDINLLPQVYRPWKPSAKQIFFSCSIIVAIALLFPLYQVVAKAMDETANLETKYAILNAELQRRQAELVKREPLQKAVNDYRTIVNMGGGFSEDLQVINSRAEELGIEVKSISHEGNTITISCEAVEGDYITFRDYLTALEECGRFFSPIPPPEGYPYISGGTIKLEPKSSE